VIPAERTRSLAPLDGSLVANPTKANPIERGFRIVRYSTDLVVVDLEATCETQGDNDVSESAIVEIGAVRLDRKTLAETAAFSELVRPRDVPLMPWITELTGITPAMLEGKETFDVVAPRFVAWCGPKNKFVLTAWGAYYDVPLLRKEFRAFGLDFRGSFVGGAFDVRALAVAWLAEHRRSTTGVTLESALDKMGLAEPDRAHRALDDARATARVLRFVHGEGKAPDAGIGTVPHG